MGEKNLKMIDPLSCHSLIIGLFFNQQSLGTATGFTIEYNDKPYLVTNWHVVSGRDSNTKEPLDKKYAAIPNKIRVAFHIKDKLGTWLLTYLNLYNESGSPVWLEHKNGNEVDVVMIPLENLQESIVTYPLDLNLSQTDIAPSPGMPAFIVGYPLGFTVSKKSAWPIWKTGHIACDHDLQFNEKDAFLIDASTRGGMSGSPVLIRPFGAYRKNNGNFTMGKIETRFLGIYSGRIGSLEQNSDIGIVWKPNIIEEILIQNKISKEKKDS